MKKKMIPVIVAVLLILVIVGAAAGKMLYDKYSYSRERVDLDTYFQVSADRRAIVLQDEMVAEQAVVKDGVCYFDLDTVHRYMNEIFYADTTEHLLLYTTATDTAKVRFGETFYSTAAGSTDLGYVIAYEEDGAVYVAADFVKLYTNFSYEVFERQMQVYTQWGIKKVAVANKDTAVRERGGVKSAILRDLAEGESVEILEEMETWSKVKTSDAIIGYVENKRLKNFVTEQETPVTDYTAPEYTSISMPGKVNLGFHAIGATGGNVTLDAMAAEAKGINVIAPTWLSMIDNEGTVRSFGQREYVSRAHEMGLDVWVVADNFNYRNETQNSVDELAVLSVTSKRENLVNNIMTNALSLGVDGINVDFEGLKEECGVHYIQFLRELSVRCRANGLVLSVDNYVPFQFNDFYRLDVQGEIADYVIIMGYDEHWHGSGDPGSVASIGYVSNGLDKTIEEVPSEKVINALPFYTIQWRTEGSTVTDQYITLKNIPDFLKRAGVQKVWDETACQNYVEWNEGNALYQVWLEDEESISVKLNVMATKNLGGVAVWKLGDGTAGAWELVKLYAGS